MLPKLIKEIADRYDIPYHDEQRLVKKVAEVLTQKCTEKDKAWARDVLNRRAFDVV